MKQKLGFIPWSLVALTGVVAVAAAFRFFGLAWDGGYLFHPDERQILLVATRLRWPDSLSQFLSPDSPLDPKFFAYGSFPIYLIRALGIFAPPNTLSVPWSDPHLVSLLLLGRFLSGLFSLGTIVLVFLIARRLYDPVVGLIASAGMAVSVLDIQLAHFYAVDTLLTFLVAATLFFAARFAQEGRRLDAVALGLTFGLAMATKVTALPLVVPLTAAVVRGAAPHVSITPLAGGQGVRSRWRSLKGTALAACSAVWQVRRSLAGVLGIALGVFIVTQPYAVLDPVQYFGQVGTEWLVARGWLDYPYTRQYAGTVPFVYQVVQSSLWGVGLPLGVFAWGGSALFAVVAWRRQQWRDGLVLAWAAPYMLMIGAEFTKYPRYLLPLLPWLFLMAAVSVKYGIAWVTSRLPAVGRGARLVSTAGLAVALAASLAYSIAFVSIYSREHPWLQISQWIYQNVPQNSTLAIEQWDDALPVSMPGLGAAARPTAYHIQTLPMFDPDDPSKEQMLVNALENSDYVVLASRRLYATIPRLSSRYPVSSRYYRLLFDGELGFDLVAYARDDPTLAGITISNDSIDYAGLATPALLARAPQGALDWNWGVEDESLAVYDHPVPLVFKKTRSLSTADLNALLSSTTPLTSAER
ncbi:MAG: glycosyltransferase family 39 protein [Chloroflexi bacterium]|nr:glycosyltransferase family 39 protein [Chloroflexota bacterium]